MLNRIFDLNKIQNAINKFNDNAKDEYYSYLINEFVVKILLMVKSLLNIIIQDIHVRLLLENNYES